MILSAVLGILVVGVVVVGLFGFDGGSLIGNVILGNGFGENKYIDSAHLGGEWFLNNQDDDYLYYLYNVDVGKHSEKHHRLREIASLWSVSKFASYSGDDRYRDLAKKGFEFFEKSFIYDEENDFYYSEITPDRNKLGYSAFLILTLLEMNEKDVPKRDHYLEKFANGIVHMQNGDGSFKTLFYSDDEYDVDFAPGESLFALMELYEESGNEKYVEVTEKALPYYMEYWKENGNAAFVPWQSRAYRRLYDVTGDERAADFVFEMNDYLLKRHRPKEKCSNFTYWGISTAVFIEGVNEAYRVADASGDLDRKECYENYIREGSDFVLSLQITEEDMIENGYEEEALGGFVLRTGSNVTRVDNNQHAIIGFIESNELGIL